jgi:hypothetical protein
MGQREVHLLAMTTEGMVVSVDFFTALGGHSGVSHHGIYTIRNVMMEAVGRQWLFVDFHVTISIVGNPGSISTSFFTGDR